MFKGNMKNKEMHLHAKTLALSSINFHFVKTN